MLDRETLIRRFARGDAWFDTSPLYQALSRTVATDADLLDLAAEARPGQQPANMLMAAAHLLVLEHPELPFARFFASVRGDDAEPPEGAAAEFAAFCAEHHDAMTRILRERLVAPHANTHAARGPLITAWRCPRPLEIPEGFLRVCVLARRRQRPPDDARTYVRNHYCRPTPPAAASRCAWRCTRSPDASVGRSRSWRSVPAPGSSCASTAGRCTPRAGGSGPPTRR